MTTPGSYPQFRSIVLDCLDARVLGDFYRDLLGFIYLADEAEPDPDGDDWLVVQHPETGLRLALQRVPEMPPSSWPSAQIPQQLHLDFSVADKAELDAQHERAMALGAQLLQDDSDDDEEPIRIYADPAGHPFCIFVVNE